MPNITKQQAINRWDKLPMILREAVFSERNADILWGICETQHLTEDKIYAIAALTGDIIMGLLHPDDLAKEIKETTGIHSDMADLIVKEIDRKIFSLIRSEIDKAYTLPLESEIYEEIEKAGIEISETGGQVVSDIIKPEIKITKPKPLIDEPLRIIATEEGENIILPGATAPAEAAVDVAKIEGPAVLYKEETAKSVLGTRKSLGDLFGHLLGRKSSILTEGEENKESMSIAGQMEAGGFEIKKEEFVNPSEAEEKARVVHYESVLRTPISETGESASLQSSVSAPASEIQKSAEQEIQKASETTAEREILEEEIAKAKVVNFKVEDETNKKDIGFAAKTQNQIFGFVKNLFKKKNIKDVPLISDGDSVNNQLPENKPEIKEPIANDSKEKIENQGIIKEEEKPIEEIKIETPAENETFAENKLKQKSKKFLSKLTDFFKIKAKTGIETGKKAIIEPKIEKPEEIK
ncbi:hypothetical protein HZB04_00320 [Candidatus Wolfebacteria bacterium]|nr:hypothetical protein [Candidatus Wolfebacteria bacterium]